MPEHVPGRKGKRGKEAGKKEGEGWERTREGAKERSSVTKPEKEKRDGRHLVITVKFENPDWRAPAPLERAAFGTFLQADHRESYIFDDFFSPSNTAPILRSSDIYYRGTERHLR